MLQLWMCCSYGRGRKLYNACSLALRGTPLLLTLVLHVWKQIYGEDSTTSTWCQMFNYRRLAVVGMGKDDKNKSHAAGLVHGTSGSSSSSSAGQASKRSSSELVLDQNLQFLQSNQQAREQFAAQQKPSATFFYRTCLMWFFHSQLQLVRRARTSLFNLLPPSSKTSLRVCSAFD